MWRITLVFGFLLLLYIGIIGRLFYWQIITASDLQEKAQQQHTNDLRVAPERGEIVDAHGSPIVVNQKSYIVYAEPNHIDNVDYFSRLISQALTLPKDDIRSLIADPKRKWVSLARNIDMKKKQELEKLALPGLGFENTSIRFYPEASMAAHLLGFVGQDSEGKPKGYFGVEGFYERELTGKEGRHIGEWDGLGRPMLIGDQTRIDAQDGRTLVLWLDRSIQFIVEKRLKEGMEKYGAKEGTVVVMDPKTGGILAMASYPNYDPSHYSEFSDMLYKNPAVASSYEPGSTFKPLIMAAGINEGVLTKDTMTEETGQVKIGEYSIKTWNDEYHGPISMKQVLQYSSNVGMVSVSRLLGNNQEFSYIKNYGIGEKTNVDLEEENSPTLRDKRSWVEIDYATASFGQGIAVTPLQITRAIASLANDGWLMEPQVVKEFKDRTGRVTKVKEKRVRQVVSAKSARAMTQMLVDAVKYGEAKWAAPKGYKIAGKTGTAQIPVAGHYDDKKTITSFIGYAPADDPQFVMLVTLREPVTSQWGSETAAPLFFSIAKDIFSYLGISPSM